MAVRVELSLVLRKYVPGYDDNDGILLEYVEGKTVRQVINELDIPKDKVFSVLVNRKPSNVGHILQDGDLVSLLMIIGAG